MKEKVNAMAVSQLASAPNSCARDLRRNKGGQQPPNSSRSAIQDSRIFLRVMLNL